MPDDAPSVNPLARTVPRVCHGGMKQPRLTTAPVDTHIGYATVVGAMTDAWAFVMAHVEEFPTPSVHITPVWSYPGEGPSYEAVVEGDV